MVQQVIFQGETWTVRFYVMELWVLGHLSVGLFFYYTTLAGEEVQDAHSTSTVLEVLELRGAPHF